MDDKERGCRGVGPWYCTSGFHKILGIFGAAKQLSVSQGGLSSIQLVSYYTVYWEGERPHNGYLLLVCTLQTDLRSLKAQYILLLDFWNAHTWHLLMFLKLSVLTSCTVVPLLQHAIGRRIVEAWALHVCCSRWWLTAIGLVHTVCDTHTINTNILLNLRYLFTWSLIYVFTYLFLVHLRVAVVWSV
jgi:hypothetical protein